MIRNRVRRDADHFAVADQQRGAAKVDASPHRRDGVKLVTGPAEALGLVTVASGEEGPQALQSGLPAGVRYIGRTGRSQNLRPQLRDGAERRQDEERRRPRPCAHR